MITPIVFLVLNLAIIGAFVWTLTLGYKIQAKVGELWRWKPAYTVLLSVLAPITVVIAIGWNLSWPLANFPMATMLAIWFVYWSRRLNSNTLDYYKILENAVNWGYRLTFMTLAYGLINIGWSIWALVQHLVR